MDELDESDRPSIAGWKLVARLGAGGMGVVYLAENLADGARLALKVIHAGYSSDDTFRSRFRREVATSRLVTGPHVASIIDADPDGNPQWLATEYVSGPTLLGHVQAEGALDSEQVWVLAAALLEGLAEIHAAGVVHRDLKPSNVILAAEGPVIIDFGIASAVDATSLTATGVSIGSAGWMAPEQVLGEQVGMQADVFGWGALVAFAASGQPPFGVGRAEAMAYRVAHGEPDLSGLPRELAGLVARSMAKNPEDRPTVSQLRAAVLGGGDSAVTAPMASSVVAPTVVGPYAFKAAGPRSPLVTGRSVALAASVAVIVAAATALLLRFGPTTRDAASGDLGLRTSPTAPITSTTAAATTTSRVPIAPGSGPVAHLVSNGVDPDPNHWRASQNRAPETFQQRFFANAEWQLVDEFPVNMSGCGRGQTRIAWRSLGIPVRSGVTFYRDTFADYPVEVDPSGGPSMEGTMIVGNCEQPAFWVDVDSLTGTNLTDVVLEATFYDPAVG